MAKLNLGAVTAYADAVKAGFTGTREEFGEWLANVGKNTAEVVANLEESKKVLAYVNTAGETQVQAVQDEGAVQIGNVEDAAEAKKTEIGGLDAVQFDLPQDKTDAQKEQARTNIGAASQTEVDNLSEAIGDVESDIYKCVVDETISEETTEKVQFKKFFPCKFRKGYEFKFIISNALKDSVQSIIFKTTRRETDAVSSVNENIGGFSPTASAQHAEIDFVATSDAEYLFIALVAQASFNDLKIEAHLLRQSEAEVDFNSKFIIAEKSKNLLNPDALSRVYLKNDGTTSGANTAYKTTDFFPVVPNMYLLLSTDRTLREMRFVCLYDKKQTFISGTFTQDTTGVLIPDGAAYARVTMLNEYADHIKAQLELRLDTNPTGYETYNAGDYDFADRSVANLTARVKQSEDKAVTATRAIDSPHFGWIDDDGKAYVYSSLYPWAIENNVPFMAALITQHIETGKSGWMTVEQVQEMYTAHPELVSYGSHTRDHVNASSMETADIDNQIGTSKADIERWGIPCNVMVYPNGQVNDAVLEYVRKYYKYGLQAGGGNGGAGTRVNYPPIGTYKLMRRTIGQTADVDLLKTEIDLTIANNGLLIFMSHCNSADSGNTDAEAEFAVYNEILSYIRGKGYDFEPVEQICDIHRNLLELGQWSSAENVEGYFVIDANGNVVSDAAGNKQIFETIGRIMDLEERVAALET